VIIDERIADETQASERCGRKGGRVGASRLLLLLETGPTGILK